MKFVVLTVEKFKDSKRKLEDVGIHCSQTLTAARLPKIDLPSLVGTWNNGEDFFSSFRR